MSKRSKRIALHVILVGLMLALPVIAQHFGWDLRCAPTARTGNQMMCVRDVLPKDKADGRYVT